MYAQAALSSTCITAVDQLKPIHASSIMKALESAEFSQEAFSLLSEVELDGQLLEVAKSLQGKILWDIPASKESEFDEALIKLLPKVYSRCRCVFDPLEHHRYGI